MTFLTIFCSEDRDIKNTMLLKSIFYEKRHCLELILQLFLIIYWESPEYIIFSNFVGFQLEREFISRSFTIFSSTWGNVFQDCCFSSERFLNQQQPVLLLHAKKIKGIRFSSQDEVFILKVLSRLCQNYILNKLDLDC